MTPNMRKWFELPPLLNAYKRRLPLVLINGLAEQSESWFGNRVYLSRHFDVKVPELLVYDGEALHRWIDSGGEVTVDYLTRRLAHFLDDYVQRPPYHLVGSSLGCQVALTYATAYPEKVSKLVLICPSGFHGDENLPMIEGISRSNYAAVVKSAFYRDHFASEDLVRVRAQVSGSEVEKRRCPNAARHGGSFRRGALTYGAPTDPCDLGCQRPGSFRRAGRDSRCRPDSAGDPGRHSEMRARAPDRKGRAGQSIDRELRTGQAQDDSAGPRSQPFPVPANCAAQASSSSAGGTRPLLRLMQ